ncbi:28S ribosomal protein S31, mitochondrial isoform X2 [Cephus cinctus]|uniref:Small ribosomal subunit protein mS31 n=1 Tax=Cephus cinctus TaxID=211228 RepID=A0AAJ7RCR0_CEPCN|nr:28S ribosomal protein S31, mitochondrial isoform X2 [Cephus cinctus]
MLSLRILSRNIVAYSAVSSQRLHTSVKLLESSGSSSSSSSDSDSDNEQPKTKTAPVETAKKTIEESQQDTTDMLNNLLLSMTQKPKISKTIDVSPKIKKPKAVKDVAPRQTKTDDYEGELIGAAKKVAESLQGDREKTEAELLGKLLQSTSTDESSEGKSEKIDESISLNDLIARMKVDRTPRKMPQMFSRDVSRSTSYTNKMQSVSSELRNLHKKREPFRFSRKMQPEGGNLRAGEPMNIFINAASSLAPEVPQLSTWEILAEEDKKLSITHPPENIFQELILWTEQRKLWKFPIDNEQGLEEEQNVHFSEHVFTQRHLEGWCPKKGPIRHFMELVCVGLSKNPYLTAEEKKNHVLWYKDYFASKQELLLELNAIQGPIPTSSSEENQIESQ